MLFWFLVSAARALWRFSFCVAETVGLGRHPCIPPSQLMPLSLPKVHEHTPLVLCDPPWPCYRAFSGSRGLMGPSLVWFRSTGQFLSIGAIPSRQRDTDSFQCLCLCFLQAGQPCPHFPRTLSIVTPTPFKPFPSFCFGEGPIWGLFGFV